jgi:hypothetical protein
MTRAAEPDPVLPLVRAGTAVLFVLAVANGAFLYFFPSMAEPDYAWAIALPVSAAFIGAGYLAGALGTGIGIFKARYWRSVRALVPGFFLLTATLFVATLIESEQFRWDYFPTWMWTVVYAVAPFAAVYLWNLQERVPGEQPERDSRLPSLWVPAGLLGVLLGIASVVLFAAPDSVLEEWPWEITPLLARVFGSWYLLAAVILIVSAASVRKAHEIPIPLATVAAWSLLTLLLPLLHPDAVDTDGAGFWLWLGLHAAVLASCVFAVVRSATLMRADGARL